MDVHRYELLSCCCCCLRNTPEVVNNSAYPRVAGSGNNRAQGGGTIPDGPGLLATIGKRLSGAAEAALSSTPLPLGADPLFGYQANAGTLAGDIAGALAEGLGRVGALAARALGAIGLVFAQADVIPYDQVMGAYVVRGAVATPLQLQNGVTEHRAVPGLIGFSVQSAPGMTIEQLAAAGQFKNAQISVTTREEPL